MVDARDLPSGGDPQGAPSLPDTASEGLSDSAGVAGFHERQQAYIERHAPNNILLQAYLGQPISMIELEKALDSFSKTNNSNFWFPWLVRFMYFSDAADERIYEAITRVPFHLTAGERSHCYWSENHLIIWDMAAWLLHESKGMEATPGLRPRLIRYLQLRAHYGFSEFNSKNYLPFTLAALLNLSDFAEDSTIREFATAAAHRLMKDILLPVNNKGVHFSTTGRGGSTDKFSAPYGYRLDSIIYLLLGKGAEPREHAYKLESMLPTSQIDVRSVIASYRENLDFDQVNANYGPEAYADLPRKDRVLLNWSSGRYFSPEAAKDTFWMMDTLDLWEHSHFKDFASLASMPSWSAATVSKMAQSFSRSSVLNGARIKIHKRGAVVLSSVEDYLPGHRGYQQWPWVANTGTLAVWTQSGSATRGISHNSHLPYVKQEGNVALILYRPNWDIQLYSNDTSVRLAWPGDQLDAVVEVGPWLCGREDTGYIAIYRDGYTSGEEEPNTSHRRNQVWVAMVGNEATHGSFKDFVESASNASVQCRKPTPFRPFSATVSVDGKTLTHQWE